MANGRGSLECCYCVSYRCHNPDWHGYDAVHEAGECLHHRATLPDTTADGLNRVCRDFRPADAFTRDSDVTADERLTDFPLELAPGFLYGFDYFAPSDVRALATITPEPGSAEPPPDV